MNAYRRCLSRMEANPALQEAILRRVRERSAAAPPVNNSHAGNLARAAGALACLALLLAAGRTIGSAPSGPAAATTADTGRPAAVTAPANTTAAPAAAVTRAPQTSAPPAAPAALGVELQFTELAPLDAAKRYIPGYFTRDLSREELLALLGSDELLSEWESAYTLSALAGFDGEGVLDHMEIRLTGSGRGVYLEISARPGVGCAALAETQPVRVQGAELMAGYWDDGAGTATHAAAFTRDGIYGYLETQDAAEPQKLLSALLANLLVRAQIRLDAVEPGEIPAWRDDMLRNEEARGDADFGALVPARAPEGFAFAQAHRVLGQGGNTLSLRFEAGLRELSWRIRYADASCEARRCAPGDTRRYDLALYPIPRAESVPDELREVVDNPVFRADELTLDMVKARAYHIADAGDNNTGARLRFSILYGDKVVELTAKGVDPADIFGLLQSLRTDE